MFSAPNNFGLRLIKAIDFEPSDRITYGVTTKLYHQTDKMSPTCHQAGDILHFTIYPCTASLRSEIKSLMNKYEFL